MELHNLSEDQLKALVTKSLADNNIKTGSIAWASLDQTIKELQGINKTITEGIEKLKIVVPATEGTKKLVREAYIAGLEQAQELIKGRIEDLREG